MKAQKFTIKRSTWHRGDRSLFFPQLLVPQTGRMCCLGHIACQLGYARDEIRGAGTPAEVEDTGSFRKAGFVGKGGDTVLTSEMIEVNDDPEITDDVREQKLKKLAAKRNITLEFV